MKAANRFYVTTQAGQLHGRRIGSGPAVILLQILPFSTVLLEPLIAALAARGYDAIALDLMGYGRSDRREGFWSVERHAAVLDEALAFLELEPVCVVSGHFTAMVATELAIQNPGRLERLVLDGVPLWPRDVARQRLAAPHPPAIWSADGAELQKLWQAAFGLLKKFHPDLVLTAENTPFVAEAVFGFVETTLAPGSAEAIFRYDLESRLPHIATPTLVVGSPTDSLRDRHDRAVGLIPGAAQHLFEDIHPLYALDRPERAAAYADMLAAFIGR